MRGAEHGHAEYAARISEVKHRRHVEEGDSALIAYQRTLSNEVVEQVGVAQHDSLGLTRGTSGVDYAGKIPDRKRDVWGQRVYVRIAVGGRRIIQNKPQPRPKKY